ncbi:MAG: hypothetical protein PHS14_13140 [Elusimicrobia bacterium]|nr:hypothetical protein [Elusimicrobiota bacterium]
MTWVEANLSLTIAAEERRGFVVRERMRMAKAREDAAAAALSEGLSKRAR